MPLQRRAEDASRRLTAAAKALQGCTSLAAALLSRQHELQEGQVPPSPDPHSALSRLLCCLGMCDGASAALAKVGSCLCSARPFLRPRSMPIAAPKNRWTHGVFGHLHMHSAPLRAMRDETAGLEPCHDERAGSPVCAPLPAPTPAVYTELPA